MCLAQRITHFQLSRLKASELFHLALWIRPLTGHLVALVYCWHDLSFIDPKATFRLFRESWLLASWPTWPRDHSSTIPTQKNQSRPAVNAGEIKVWQKFPSSRRGGNRALVIIKNQFGHWKGKRVLARVVITIQFLAASVSSVQCLKITKKVSILQNRALRPFWVIFKHCV